MTIEVNDVLARIVFNGGGLVNVVVQDAASHAVLMVAWADRAALAHTMRTGQATYFSRSRQAQWIKGETSGHTQQVHELSVDCDGDAVLYRVSQVGPACHTGRKSCFDTQRIVIEPEAKAIS